MTKFISLLFCVAFLAFTITACGSDQTPTEPPPTVPAEPGETLVETSAPPTPEPTTEAPPPTAAPVLEPLPPEPQEIEFQAADGQALLGVYYPAAVNPAPMVVLHHWAPGDQRDWIEIAYWLQNRGLGGQTDPAAPWLDSSWFPPIPPEWEEQSFGVFTFTFRGCEGGCSSFEPDGWLQDAQAAMETARGLEGVNPQRIVAVGASIGADGSPDGCFWLNQQYENSCLGGFSFSPGSYLTVPYADAVDALGAEQPPKPGWCLFAVEDTAAAEACQSATGDHYRVVQYEGQMHGMDLINPDVEPNALLLLLEFIALSMGL
ncbi:MAG: hypothetical protein DRI81_04145 [Chloroflexi bacterium]|nr:MAG: hypothetical protein DRI81_04145 [Chloroflexota bacterium]